MTNTVKMPRQLNRRLKEIQRQRSYIDSAKEAALALGFMFFFVVCLWGATEAYDWLCAVTVENTKLKIELHEERAAFKAMFNQDAEARRQAQFEREQAIKDLCRRDERGCRIMRVTWSQGGGK